MNLEKLKKRRTMWMAATVLFAIAGLGMAAENVRLAIANFIVSGIYAVIFIKSNANIKKLEAEGKEA